MRVMCFSLTHSNSTVSKMDKILCSVRDLKANSYGAPVVFGTPLDAVRAFTDVLGDQRTLVGLHPADFQLVYIADFNEVTGVVKSIEHVVLMDGASYSKD